MANHDEGRRLHCDYGGGALAAQCREPGGALAAPFWLEYACAAHAERARANPDVIAAVLLPKARLEQVRRAVENRRAAAANTGGTR